MGQASVKITSDGIGRGSVSVDGVDVSSITNGVDIKVSAGTATRVALSLALPDIESLDISGAVVIVSGVEMPISVEMALYKHLATKHGPLEIDVTTLGSTARVFALKSA